MSDAELERAYFAAYPTIDDERRPGHGSGYLEGEIAARGKLRLEALLLDTPEGMRLELLSASDGLMVLYISGLRQVSLSPEKRWAGDLIFEEAHRRGGRVEEMVFRDFPLDELTLGNDQKLRAAMRFLERQHAPGFNFERILSKIPPAYDPNWEQELIRASTAWPDRRAPEARNVEALTVLRRLQQLPDPLQISIEGNDRRECVYPQLPSLDVGYANRDAERLPLLVEQADPQNHSWFVQVDDVSGRQPTFRKGRIPRNGSSGVIFTSLTFDSKRFVRLDLKRFLEPALEPGQYQIRVLFHASGGASERDLEHRILCVSSPILLTVKPAVAANSTLTARSNRT